MKNIKTITWHTVVVLVITYLSYSFRFDIVFKDIEFLISILQTTSAMIFTIMGIWIAYVYPNAVLRIVQPTKVVAIYSDEDLKRVMLLVGIVVSSALILVLLLLGVSARVFIIKMDIFSRHKSLFTGVGIWCLLAIIYAQLFCIYAVIASSVNFLIDLNNLNNKKSYRKN